MATDCNQQKKSCNYTYKVFIAMTDIFQVDFANRFIGGGVLGRGRVQVRNEQTTNCCIIITVCIDSVIEPPPRSPEPPNKPTNLKDSSKSSQYETIEKTASVFSFFFPFDIFASQGFLQFIPLPINCVLFLVQEEIRFTVCPELIAAMLFMECMDDNEAIIVQGYEQFSETSGYGESLTYVGDYKDMAQVIRRICF